MARHRLRRRDEVIIPPARIRVISSVTSAGLTLAIVLWMRAVAYPGDSGASRPGFAEGYFSAQASAIINGGLAVPEASLPGECYRVDDLCFGYYGLTPSLLRLPLLVVSNLVGAGTPGLAGLMLPVAIMAGVIASLVLVDQVWRIASRPQGVEAGGRRWLSGAMFVAATVAVGPGSLLLQVMRPAVFEEAIAWSASLAAVGLLFFVRWVSSRRVIELGLATVAFTLSANARPTGGVVALAVGAAGLALVVSSRGEVLRRQLMGLAALALAPLISALLVFRLKFGASVPDLRLNEQIPEQPWWAEILATNGGSTFSAGFAPTNLWAYLRPDAIAWHLGADGLTASILRPEAEPIAWLPPLQPGGLFVESVASVSSLAPLTLLLLVVALVSPPLLGRARGLIGSGALASPSPAWFSRLLLVAALSGVVVTVTAVSLTNRYLGDFIPGLALATAVGSVSLTVLLHQARAWLAAIVLSIVLLLAAYGAVANVAIALAQVMP